MEGGHAGHDADEHAHGMRIVVERLHELREVVVEERVAHNLRVPRLGFHGVGQLAIDEEVGDLEEGRLFSQLLDRVAAIAQNAAVAVNVADRRARHGSVLVRGIVHDKAADLCKGVRLHRVAFERHLVRLCPPASCAHLSARIQTSARHAAPHLASAVVKHRQRLRLRTHRQHGELRRGARARAANLPALARLLVLNDERLRLGGGAIGRAGRMRTKRVAVHDAVRERERNARQALCCQVKCGK